MPTLFPDPFDALQQFQQALDSFRTSGWLSTGPSAGGAYPPINVFRKGDDLVPSPKSPGFRNPIFRSRSSGGPFASPAANLSGTAIKRPCTVVSVSQDALIERSPCRSKSTPIGLRRNAGTGSWPYTSRARSATSRRRSPWVRGQ